MVLDLAHQNKTNQASVPFTGIYAVIENLWTIQHFMTISLQLKILIVHAHQKIVLTAFGDMITELLGNDDVTPTEEALLRSPQILELKYQNSETVKMVH